jgi:hypothetical protein
VDPPRAALPRAGALDAARGRRQREGDGPAAGVAEAGLERAADGRSLVAGGGVRVAQLHDAHGPGLGGLEAGEALEEALQRQRPLDGAGGPVRAGGGRGQDQQGEDGDAVHLAIVRRWTRAAEADVFAARSVL